MPKKSDAFDRATPAHLIERHDPSVWAELNRAPFTFRHNLQNHPLLEISRLAEAAEVAIDNRSRRNAGVYISNSEEFADLPVKARLVEALARIESGTHWIKLSGLQDLHPDYEELLKTIFAEIDQLSGRLLGAPRTWAGLTAFISPPNSVTHYHFDHDANFLFQIKGSKIVHLFDQNDPSIVTQDERERFYRGDAVAGRYRDELAGKDKAFHLVPGMAVHHPPLAPHIVNNDDNVSISLSVYYSDAALDARARIYQANYCLRRLGLNPRPPGKSAISDRLKTAAFNAISKSHPETWNEFVYSGIDRVFLPSRAVNWIAKRVIPGRRAKTPA